MKISIIVAVYNAEKYLHYCVESLINQTYKDIEIILVDDGSTDHSLPLCDDYAKKYDFIRVFHKENGGQSSARNLGIEKAEGDYLSFVDSDDMLHPQFCEIMVNVLNQTGLNIVACMRNKYDSYEKIIVKDVEPSFKILDTKDIIFDEFIRWKKHRFINTLGTKIVRKDLVQKYRFIEKLRDEEDTTLVLSLFLECEKIGFIEEILYFYFLSSGSVTRNKKNEIKNIGYLFESRKSIIEDLIKNNYPYINQGVSNIFVKCLSEYIWVLKPKDDFFEKERDALLKTFEPYEKYLEPYETYIYKAFKDKKYFIVYTLLSKIGVNIYKSRKNKLSKSQITI